MTTATVPLGAIVYDPTPFTGRYGAHTGATFEPVFGKDGKPLLGTAGKLSKEATSQWFTVTYHFNGHKETRLVRRSLISGVEDARIPALDGKGQAMRFFFEEWCHKDDGRITSCRVEGDPSTQTLKYITENGESMMLVKGFHPATPDELMAAMEKAQTNRDDYKANKKANSLHGQNSNIAAMVTKSLAENNQAMMAMFMAGFEKLAGILKGKKGE